MQEPKKRSLSDVKSVTYLSLILCVFCIGVYLPFLNLASMLGVTPSLLMLAAFQPYFKWKATWLIHLFLCFMNLIANFPFTMYSISYFNSSILFLPVELSVQTKSLIAVSMLVWLSLVARTAVLFTAMRVLRKAHFWDRFQL